MSAHREIEIKLAVSNPHALMRLIRHLGFRVCEKRRFESNRLYDFADHRLRRSRSLLRIRQEPGRCTLTFKGPPINSRHYKMRGEIETQIESSGQLEGIFVHCGLRQVFRYDKYRTTFARAGKRQEGKLEFDETPIGNFIELEGPGAWIDRVATDLGFPRKEYIKASYAALYFAWRRRTGRKAENMVFASRKK